MAWRLAGDHYGGGGVGPPGPPGPPGPGGGTSVPSGMINDSGGAVAMGQPLYTSSAGKYKLAKADAIGTARMCGVAQDPSTANGATGNVQLTGVLDMPTAAWDALTGDSGGLVANALYWVSPATAGMLVKPAPSTAGQEDALYGQALDATRMDLRIFIQPLGV